MVVKVGKEAPEYERNSVERRLMEYTGRHQRFRPHWSYCLPQCVSTSINNEHGWAWLTLGRVEHQDIDIVAVNDPFIEPHYAVSRPSTVYTSFFTIPSKSETSGKFR